MLNAALPIIDAASRKGFRKRGTQFRTPVLIDTHAGPGVWDDGARGSPMLLAECASHLSRHLVLCELNETRREALIEHMDAFPWPFEVFEDYRTALSVLGARPGNGCAPYGLVNIDPTGAVDLELDRVAYALTRPYLRYFDVLLHASETAQRRAPGHERLGEKIGYLERIGFVFRTFEFPGDLGRNAAWRWRLSFGSRWRGSGYMDKVAAGALKAGLVEPGRLF